MALSSGAWSCQTPAVQVTLLGGVAAQVRGVRLSLGGPKQRAVFALLALNANHTVPLDRLVNEIWLDEPPARATLALQAYISRLRRVLADADAGQNAHIVTRPPGWVLQIRARSIDAHLFTSYVADARALLATHQSGEAAQLLRAALELWSGEPLADLDDAAFASEHVSRLNEQRLEASELLYEVELAAGAPAAVIEPARAFVVAHPYRERAWSALILALYRSGRQADALSAARELRQTLVDGLGLDPSLDSQRLEQRILVHDPTLDGPAALPTAHSPDSVPAAQFETVAPEAVLGRAAELDAIVSAVDTARQGTGRMLVIEGPPGMGKSTILRRLENSVRAIGGVVLRASGVATGATPALWPWITVVRQLREIEPEITSAMLETPAAEILALLDPATGTAASPIEHFDAVLARTRLYRLLIDLLTATRKRHPLAIIFDDAHWLDADTVNLLALAAGELTSHGVLFAVGLRPDEVTEACESVSALGASMGGASLRLSLSGLAPADVGLIVQRLSGADPPAEVVDAMCGRTGGNPFFIEELARLLISERRLDAEGVYTVLPDGVRDVIRRRLDRLPEQTLAPLRVLAILGRGASSTLLARALAVDEDTVLDGCEAAVLAGLLVDDADSGGYALSHDLVRQTLADGLSDARRIRLHARIGTALQADQHTGSVLSPERTVELASHLTAAVPIMGPSAALDYLLTAADDALARLASARFTEYLTIAQQLTDQIADPDVRARRIEEIRTRQLVGRLLGPGGEQDSSETLIPPSPTPDSSVWLDPDKPAAWWSSVAVFIAAGNNGAAAAAAESALDRDLPAGAAAAAHFMRGVARLSLGHLDQAQDSLQCTEELLRRTPGGAARGLFKFAGTTTALQAAIATIRGDRAQSAALRQAAEQTPDQTAMQTVGIKFWCSWCLVQEGDPDGAAQLAIECANHAATLGPTFYRPWCDLIVAWRDALNGDASALARASRAQEKYLALGTRHQLTTQLVLRAEAHAHHGDTETARKLVLESRAVAAMSGECTLGPRLTAFVTQLVPASTIDAGTS